jgi:hypothetical protein
LKFTAKENWNLVEPRKQAKFTSGGK